MTRYVLRRLALSVVTLFLLVTIVFLIVNVFPDDPGRRIAGPFAPQETVDALNERLGSNDPLPVQYARLLRSTVTFDFGDSFQFSRPVGDLLWAALLRSAKLVALGLFLTIPISIAAGVFAARRRNTSADRSVVTLGLASSSIPDFVSGVTLQYIIGVKLGLLPVLAVPPRGAGPLEELEYLLLPAFAIVVVYFGYIARMTRAGTIQALDSDYTRTAVMKGLSTRRVLSRHVLRNALQPTVVGDRHLGRLPVRRAGGARADLQLPRTRQPHLHRGIEEGHPAPVGRRHPRRHHLHGLHVDRRPHHRLDEPPGPAGSGRVVA